MKKIKSGRFKWNPLSPYLINNRAFTLIEAVTALFVFSLCVSLFSIAGKQLQVVQKAQQSDRELEWHLFLNQFEYDIQQFRLYEVTSAKATFVQVTNSGESQKKVTYKRELQKLIRQVGGQGYQPMLMKLRKFTFELKGAFLVIHVEFLNGEKYQSQISLVKQMQMKETINE